MKSKPKKTGKSSEESKRINKVSRKIETEKILHSPSWEYFNPYLNKAISQKDIIIKSATSFGTPQYLMDEDYLIQRTKLFINSFRQHLPNFKAFYAFKSNDLPYLLDIVRKNGAYADVASLFELRLALKLDFEKIIFTAPVKTEEDLSLAISNSKKVILNIDNLTELRQLCKMIEKYRPWTPLQVCFRICPQPNKDNPSWNKFGLTPDELRLALEEVSSCSYLHWSGLHIHSSWNLNSGSYLRNISYLAEIISQLSPEQRQKIKFIDLGGGFLTDGSGTLKEKINSKSEKSLLALPGCTSGNCYIQLDLPQDIEIISEEISSTFKKHLLPLLNPETELWLEPGRFISALPTTIILKVISLKRGNIYVDGGINLVGSDSFTFEYYPIINISRPSLKNNNAVIYGPLCDPDDLWGYSYFGEPCQEGDLLAVLHQGAYTFSTAWRWQRPTPAYVAFQGNKDNKFILAKKAESFAVKYKECRF
jgi:diaminopimelate decarboxylase